MLKICCQSCKHETKSNKRYPCVKCLDTFWLNQWEPKANQRWNKGTTKEEQGRIGR